MDRSNYDMRRPMFWLVTRMPLAMVAQRCSYLCARDFCIRSVSSEFSVPLPESGSSTSLSFGTSAVRT